VWGSSWDDLDLASEWADADFSALLGSLWAREDLAGDGADVWGSCWDDLDLTGEWADSELSASLLWGLLGLNLWGLWL